MKLIAALFLVLAVQTAHAAEWMVIVNDAERAALLEALDEATKAKGLQIAPNTVYLANKIKAAPVITDRKDEPPKEEDKQ